MKRKTQALYARHAAVQSSAASLHVHQARTSLELVEQEIAQRATQAQADTAQVNTHLAQGASAATFALNFATQLQHQHHAQRLQDELHAQLIALRAATEAQSQMRRKEKSAEKMGERLDRERLIAQRRRLQLEQDELVCHVFDLSA